MKSRKITKIIIILIIVLVAIIGTIALMMLFTSDKLKSNKELFFKYAINSIKDDEETKKLINYLEKQKNTPFESNGEYSTKIEDSEEMLLNKKEQKVLNNTVINFNGKSDLTKNKVYESISVDFSDDNKFPINIMLTKDFWGFQTEYVSNKYIVTSSEVKKLKEVLENASKDETEQAIKELVEYIKPKLSNYTKAMMDGVNNEKFTKINNNGVIGYKASLSNSDIKNMIISLLKELKNDQDMINKINDIINMANKTNNNTTITTEDIDKYIDLLQQNNNTTDSINNLYEETFTNVEKNEIKENNDSEGNENIEITIFLTKQKVKSIKISNNNNELNIERENTSDKAEYTINYNNDSMNMNLKTTFDGINEANNVSELYELSYDTSNESKIKMTHTLTRNVKFSDDISMEELDEDNTINLDKMNKEKKKKFLKKLSERYEKIQQYFLEKLKIDNNIIMYEIPIAGMSIGLISNNNEEILSHVEESKAESSKAQAKEKVQLAYMDLRTSIMTEMSKNSSYDAREHMDSMVEIVKEYIQSDYTQNEKNWCKLDVDGNDIIMIFSSEYLDKDLKYVITISSQGATFNGPTEIDK